MGTALLFRVPRRWWRKVYAVPPEHGSWVWWLGPLAIGLAAGGRPGPDALVLSLAALFAFLIRQPLTLLVKVRSGRRARSDWTPALFWTTVYALAGSACLTALILLGHGRVLWLAVPGVPVFARYLWLVSRRAERRQLQLELLGAAVLALAAPAAYWVAGGTEDLTAWTLWALTGLHSAGSIVHIYLRLTQRAWKVPPPHLERWRHGRASLGVHVFNLALSMLAVGGGLTPPLVPLAFLFMLLYALEGTWRPAAGWRPNAIGLLQLGASVTWTALIALAYLVKA